MKITATEAIVLTTRDYGESDRLVAFHTASRGKIRGIAKGARRSRKRFANTFEPSSLVELEWRERNSYVWIEACKLVEPFLTIRADIEKWALAALFSEIILEMVPECEPQPDLFLLHKEMLGRLEKDKDPLNVVLLSLLRFQFLMGYMPAMDGCAVCGRGLKTALKWYWQAGRGKLVCPDHVPLDQGHIALDLGTVELIHYARKMPLDKIWRLRMRQAIKMPLFRGFLDWIRYHTGREIRSLKVIEQIMPSMGAGAAMHRGPRPEGAGCVQAFAGPEGFETVSPVKN
ncbi:MAG: DNA repair protein RecO [Syntrophobacteraceae bacterium]